jgi:hypothetical protein
MIDSINRISFDFAVMKIKDDSENPLLGYEELDLVVEGFTSKLEVFCRQRPEFHFILFSKQRTRKLKHHRTEGFPWNWHSEYRSSHFEFAQVNIRPMLLYPRILSQYN